MVRAQVVVHAKFDAGERSQNVAVAAVIKSNAFIPRRLRESITLKCLSFRCQNFDEMQDRLIKMQGELSWLTAALMRSNNTGQYESNLTGKVQSVEASPFSNNGDLSIPHTPPGHVVRDRRTQVERHYGPWTLVALCRKFEDDLGAQNNGVNNDIVKDLIHEMYLDTTKSDYKDLDIGIKQGQSNNSIFLPPRQLLSVMLEKFLKEPDYSTDIFCRQSIWEAVECVYKDPSSPASEPWALCFNLIILLTLSAEHPLHKNDPFVQPMLQAANDFARKPSFFMSPRLVNIQALALFSLLAQQYLIENRTIGNSLFAQACILARESGLHQAGYHTTPSSNLTTIEIEERQKVFRSLYIRDRYSATTSGTLTWLPNGSCRGSPLVGVAPSNEPGGIPSDQLQTPYRAHWDLARLQDEIIRMLSSGNAPDLSTSEQQAAFGQLHQKFETWTSEHKALLSTRPATVDEISLRLAFLSTRIRLQDGIQITSDNGWPSAQELHDARLSCLLLATSCNSYPEQTLVDRLDNLLDKGEFPSLQRAGAQSSFTNSSPQSVSTSSTATSAMANIPKRTDLLTSALSRPSPTDAPALTQLPFHRLVNVFPITAIFVLARHILGMEQPSQFASTTSQGDEQQRYEISQDILLLESLLSCFRSARPSRVMAPRGNDADGDGFKLDRVLKHLIDIIHVMVGPTCRSNVDNASGKGDDMDIYAPEPMLASTSPLLLDASSNAMSMPDLHLFGSGTISPSLLGFPSSASQFMWGAPQDTTQSSSTPLLTAGSSSYAPSMAPTPPTLPDTSSDFSHFLQQMGASSPVMWDGDHGHIELQIQSQQEQCVSEATLGRPKKRPRIEGGENQDERSRFIRGVA